jgi:hypothetical protein
MLKTMASITTALLCTVALLGAGCGDKAPPKSTTTTRTQTTVEQDNGKASTSDVQETRTEQTDGSQDITRVETTTQSTPPAGPVAKP